MVIAARNEAARLPLLLADLATAPQLVAEVLVVDGASVDGTPRLAAQAGARVLACSTLRGRQQSLWVYLSSGSWMLMLHADARLHERREARTVAIERDDAIGQCAPVADRHELTAALLGQADPRRAQPIFWQWPTNAKTGDNWPTLAVRVDQEKLLLGKDARPLELFQFPEDRLEKNNRSSQAPAEVKRLQTLLAAWTATLPAKPDQDCLSGQR